MNRERERDSKIGPKDQTCFEDVTLDVTRKENFSKFSDHFINQQMKKNPTAGKVMSNRELAPTMQNTGMVNKLKSFRDVTAGKAIESTSEDNLEARQVQRLIDRIASESDQSSEGENREYKTVNEKDWAKSNQIDGFTLVKKNTRKSKKDSKGTSSRKKHVSLNINRSDSESDVSVRKTKDVRKKTDKSENRKASDNDTQEQAEQSKKNEKTPPKEVEVDKESDSSESESSCSESDTPQDIRRRKKEKTKMNRAETDRRARKREELKDMIIKIRLTEEMTNIRKYREEVGKVMADLESKATDATKQKLNKVSRYAKGKRRGDLLMWWDEVEKEFRIRAVEAEEQEIYEEDRLRNIRQKKGELEEYNMEFGQQAQQLWYIAPTFSMFKVVSFYAANLSEEFENLLLILKQGGGYPRELHDMMTVTYSYQMEQGQIKMSRERNNPKKERLISANQSSEGMAFASQDRTTKPPCRAMLYKGRCDRDNCPFSHEPVQEEPRNHRDRVVGVCWQWEKEGECTNPRCRFRHEYTAEDMKKLNKTQNKEKDDQQENKRRSTHGISNRVCHLGKKKEIQEDSTRNRVNNKEKTRREGRVDTDDEIQEERWSEDDGKKTYEYEMCCMMRSEKTEKERKKEREVKQDITENTSVTSTDNKHVYNEVRGNIAIMNSLFIEKKAKGHRNVQIHKTKDKGLGLVSKQDIAEHQIVCGYSDYKGITIEEVEANECNKRYMFGNPRTGLHYYTREWEYQYGVLINDGVDDIANNCTLEVSAGGKLNVVALEYIEAGKELLLGYGKEYWLENIKEVRNTHDKNAIMTYYQITQEEIDPSEEIEAEEESNEKKGSKRKKSEKEGSTYQCNAVIADKRSIMLDGGATLTIVRDPELLQEVKELDYNVIVQGIGQQRIKSDKGGMMIAPFHDIEAAYFPHATANVIPQKVMMEKFHVTFDAKEDSYTCTSRKDSSCQIIYEVNQQGNYMYAGKLGNCLAGRIVNGRTYTHEQCRRATAVKKMHECLCHLPYRALADMIASGAIRSTQQLCRKDIEIAKQINGECIACLMGKAIAPISRKYSINSPASEPGERQHIDIMYIVTGTKDRYLFIIMVDEKTNRICISQIANRSAEEVKRVITDAVTTWRKSNHNIKYIRMDRELSFISIKDWLERMNITAEYTSANGHVRRAERMIRTIKSRFRAALMGIRYTLPKSLYPYLVRWVVYRSNAIPSKNSGKQSPNELVHQRIATYGTDITHAFGDIVISTIPEGNSKPDNEARGQIGIVIGDDRNTQKGTMLYLLNSKRIVTRTKCTGIEVTKDITAILGELNTDDIAKHRVSSNSDGEESNSEEEAEEDHKRDEEESYADIVKDTAVEEEAQVEHGEVVVEDNQREVPDNNTTSIQEDDDEEESSSQKDTACRIPADPTATTSSNIKSNSNHHIDEDITKAIQQYNSQQAEESDEEGGEEEEEPMYDITQLELEQAEETATNNAIEIDEIVGPDANEEEDSDDESEEEDEIHNPIGNESTTSGSGSRRSSRKNIGKPPDMYGYNNVAIKITGRPPDMYGFVNVATGNMSVKQAVRESGDLAKEAVRKEISQMIERKVWERVSARDIDWADKNNQVIPSSIFLKNKFDASGNFIKIKARLVANGNFEKDTLMDKFQHASPTVCLNIVTIMLQVAAVKKLNIRTIDVTGAYLHADLPVDKNIYMYISKEVSSIMRETGVEESEGTNKILVKLKKCLYGLKETAKRWFEMINSVLTCECELEACKLDQCLYKKVRGEDIIIVLLYVDDMIILYSKENMYEEFISRFQNRFAEVTHSSVDNVSFIGMEIYKDKHHDICIKQPDSIDKILTRILGEDNIHMTCATPGSLNKKKEMEEDNQLMDEREKSRELGNIMALMYVAMRSRPDILLSTVNTACNIKEGKKSIIQEVRRIAMYINGTRDLHVTYNSNADLTLVAYADAAFDVHPMSRGHGGIGIWLDSNANSGAVINKSNVQKVASASSMEAELITLQEATDLVIWTQNILEFIQELSPKLSERGSIIYQDNKSCVLMNNNKYITFKGRSKYIDRKYFLSYDKIKEGRVKVVWLHNSYMIVDVHTKVLIGNIYRKCIKYLLGMNECITYGENIEDKGEEGEADDRALITGTDSDIYSNKGGLLEPNISANQSIRSCSFIAKIS